MNKAGNIGGFTGFHLCVKRLIGCEIQKVVVQTACSCFMNVTV